MNLPYLLGNEVLACYQHELYHGLFVVLPSCLCLEHLHVLWLIVFLGAYCLFAKQQHVAKYLVGWVLQTHYVRAL